MKKYIEYGSEFSTKVYTQSKRYYDQSKENIKFSLEVNSTFLVNSTIIGILVYVVFFLEQTNEMVGYGFSNTSNPWVTALYCCLLSFTIYSFSHVAILERKKIESGTEVEFSKDDLYLVLFNLAPVFIYLRLAFLYSSDAFVSSILCFIYAAAFFILSYVIPKERNISKPTWLKNRWNDYKKRIHSYVHLTLFVVFCLLVFYYYYTNRLSAFNSVRGIAVLDILLLFLIVLRAWFLLAYIMFTNFWKVLKLAMGLKDSLMTQNFASIDLYKNLGACAVVSLGIFSIGAIIYGIISPQSEYRNSISYIETERLANAMEGDTRMSIVEYTQHWMDQHQDSSNIYLVAGQGGGSRAGFWTASSLAQLDHFNDDFYPNLFAVSTVSGSSVGASIYLDYRKTDQFKNEHLDDLETKISNFYQRDYVTSSLLRLLFSNPLEKIIPQSFLAFRNRNEQLMREESISYTQNFGFDEYHDFYKEDFPKYDKIPEENEPLLILNTFNIDNSQKSIISPVSFPNYDHEDLMSILDGKDVDLEMGEAINLSQMFPMLSASSYIGNNQYYDGGVYDNSGLSTIRDVYKILSAVRDEKKPNSRIHIFYLQNGSGKEQVISEEEIPYDGVSALVKAASGSIFSANPSKHLRKLKRETRNMDDLFHEHEFVNKDDISLNRWVSKKNGSKMWSAIEQSLENGNLLEELKSEQGRDLTPGSHKFSVYFEKGDSLLSQRSKHYLNDMLNTVKPTSINLSGYSDVDKNPVKSDSVLIAGRINAVKNALIDFMDGEDIFISESAIHPHQKGSDMMSKQMNRRVDISFSFYEPLKTYFAPPRGQ